MGRDQPKTLNYQRLIGLPSILLNAHMRNKDFLDELRLIAEVKANQKAQTWYITNWVFKSSVGCADYPSNFYNRCRDFSYRNGVRYICFHDLLQKTSHLALQHGMNLDALSQTRGHSRIDTKKTFTHLRSASYRSGLQAHLPMRWFPQRKISRASYWQACV